MRTSLSFQEMVKYAIYVYHHVSDGTPVFNAKFEDSAGTPHKVVILCVTDYMKKPETYYGKVWLENNLGNRSYERKFKLDITDRNITAKDSSQLVELSYWHNILYGVL